MGLPPIKEAMADAGLEMIGVYDTRHQITVNQYIAMRPILDIATSEELRTGFIDILWWWDQAGVFWGDEG